jgi:hypothetical protein
VQLSALTPFTFQTEALAMGDNEARREREWRELYSQLNKLLAKEGRSSPYGEGDYWIVDDGWGDNRQMVYVFRIDFLRQDLAREVQSLLRRIAPGWEQLLLREPSSVELSREEQ